MGVGCFMQKYHVTKCSRCEKNSDNFLKKCSHVVCINRKQYMLAKKQKNTCEHVVTGLSVKKLTAKSGKYFCKDSCKFTQCTVMLLLCWVHASFPAHLKITQISGTSVPQVNLSVYLTVSFIIWERCLFHPPVSHSRIYIKKDIKRPMLSQIMIVQDMKQ